MKIKAIKQIIEWDADAERMVIINVDETDEVSDRLARMKIDSGEAEKAPDKHHPLDHDEDGRAGGSRSGDESTAALGEARKRYHAAFGKNPGPKWDVATIDAKIADKASADTAAPVPGEDDAPPAA